MQKPTDQLIVVGPEDNADIQSVHSALVLVREAGSIVDMLPVLGSVGCWLFGAGLLL